MGSENHALRKALASAEDYRSIAQQERENRKKVIVNVPNIQGSQKLCEIVFTGALDIQFMNQMKRKPELGYCQKLVVDKSKVVTQRCVLSLYILTEHQQEKKREM